MNIDSPNEHADLLAPVESGECGCGGDGSGECGCGGEGKGHGQGMGRGQGRGRGEGGCCGGQSRGDCENADVDATEAKQPQATA